MEPKDLNQLCKNSMVETLGIQFISTNETEGEIIATMPVNSHTRQPMGYLHGGASMALAETIGSAGTMLLVDPEFYNTFGFEVKTNHIKSVRTGKVKGIGKLLHQGTRTHVWDINIYDEEENLISVTRMTNMIVEKKNNNE